MDDDNRVPPSELRRARRRRVERLAANQSGVLSRPQMYAAGITRWEVRANLDAGRWRRVGQQTVSLTTGPLASAAADWAAVLEGGPRAFLDGASSLRAGGLVRFEVPVIRVSVPRGAIVRRVPGVDVRQTRRWSSGDLAPGSGVPRSRNEVAAVRAALWAVSDRQAALILTMVVQQGLTTATALGIEALRIRRDRRRGLLHAVILDLGAGVRSLGERDFARECRRRGLPEPSRQVLRRGPNGTYFLDVLWELWGLVVEIDGIQHTWAQDVVGDALRHNDVTLDNATVLRLPLLVSGWPATTSSHRSNEHSASVGTPPDPPRTSSVPRAITLGTYDVRHQSRRLRQERRGAGPGSRARPSGRRPGRSGPRR